MNSSTVHPDLYGIIQYKLNSPTCASDYFSTKLAVLKEMSWSLQNEFSGIRNLISVVNVESIGRLSSVVYISEQ
jgi:hypothetical protein